ncbi:DUF1622 domain-containing protein [Candidatus Nomurabacteria bacterium]|nr:DUF1622 domain-containing protein [Candidatus Nomurabacteria bacterium]
MTYIDYISPFVWHTGMILEFIGIFIVAISAFTVLVRVCQKGYTQQTIRAEFAQRIIFGLEFVIAADILLASVASDLMQVSRLGGIVLIRVVLGYALRKEAGIK